MKSTKILIGSFVLCTFCFIFCTGCADGNSADNPNPSDNNGTKPTSAEDNLIKRETQQTLKYLPVADGTKVFNSDFVVIDYSNSSQGYIMVEYIGTHTGKVKFQIDRKSVV